MRFRILAFGKLKTDGLRDTADYYKRILRPWAAVEEIELKPISVPDKSAATRTRVQEKEGILLLERFEKIDRGAIYLLDETGISRTTQKWAGAFQELEISGISTVSFCIGSSLGFSPAIRQRAQGTFSFGPQTFSHELARVVLLEQLYRATSVLKGHPYHNEGE